MRFAVVLLIVAVLASLARAEETDRCDVADNCPQVDYAAASYVTRDFFSNVNYWRVELYRHFPLLRRLVTEDCYTTEPPNPLCLPEFHPQGWFGETVPAVIASLQETVGTYQFPPGKVGYGDAVAATERTVSIGANMDPFDAGVGDDEEQ